MSLSVNEILLEDYYSPSSLLVIMKPSSDQRLKRVLNSIAEIEDAAAEDPLASQTLKKFKEMKHSVLESFGFSSLCEVETSLGCLPASSHGIYRG